MTSKARCISSLLVVSAAGLLTFIAPLQLNSKTEKDADLKLREQMVQMSKELGVTCAYCHNSENFKEAKNKNFKIALEHLKITNMLNSEKAFHGKPMITCYSCHQGHAQYQYSLPIAK
jgi:hypothetical protein